METITPVAKLREGFPELVKQIEVEAVAPVTAKLDEANTKLNDANKKIESFESKAAKDALLEGVKKLVMDAAAAVKVEVTEHRQEVAVAYLLSLEESKRADAVKELVKDWKPTAETKKHLGGRSDESATGTETETLETTKPDHYVEPGIEGLKKVF